MNLEVIDNLIHRGAFDALSRDVGEKPNIPQYGEYVTRWGTYESLCGKYRVDFKESDKDLLDRIKTSQFYIEWEGKNFVYVGYYDLYEGLGESGGQKQAGEGYGKHFGEYAIHRDNSKARGRA